jgi:DNA polymerase
MGLYADGDLVFIGEAPGADEDDKGRPFVGKAGKQLNEGYLPAAGTHREYIYITNVAKCRPRNNKTPGDKLIQSCSDWHLKDEMRHIKPKYVVLMGATACSLVPGIDLDVHHGIPRNVDFYGHFVTVIPMFHPAAGMHDYKYMRPLGEDFDHLKHVLKGEVGWVRDEYPNTDYREIHNIADMKRTLAGEFRRPLAIDTEYIRNRNTNFQKVPYCWSYSCQPGTGYMVDANNKELVSEFVRYVGLWREQFLFHNPEADLGVLRKIGIHIDWSRVDDTMTRAYNLGLFRLGLKVLAYRLAGMEMQDFDDLVRPYAQSEAIDYLYELAGDEWPKPDGWPKRAWSLNTYVKRALGDLDKCVVGTADPGKVSQIVMERWESWPDEIVLPAIRKYGPMPRPNIGQVPRNLVIPYACRDADATLRLRPLLTKLSKDVLRRMKKYAA